MCTFEMSKAIVLLLILADMNTILINQLVAEYKANPNCWPDLWIQGEGLNSDEQKEFINLCLQ